MSFTGSSFKLNDNNSIPAIAFGVGTKWFKLGDNQLDQATIDAIKTAIDGGFTHVDGAEVYRTDAEIGNALEGVDRSKIFLTDKYITGRSKFATPYEALEHQLEHDLKTSYVDLYLLHLPFVGDGLNLVELWKSAEKLVEDGKAKSIGVSNFGIDDLKQILDSNPKIKPSVNQIEFNPYLQNQTPGIVKFSQDNGILVEAYSPLAPLTKGKPGPLDLVLEELSSKYSKTELQILLRYTLQRGILPVTTTSKAERVKEYLEVFGFELKEEDIAKISEVGKQKTLRLYWTDEYSKYD